MKFLEAKQILNKSGYRLIESASDEFRELDKYFAGATTEDGYEIVCGFEDDEFIISPADNAALVVTYEDKFVIHTPDGKPIKTFENVYGVVKFISNYFGIVV